MSDLLTSVLIPSYRRGAKLRTCLLSLNTQIVPPNEVIVVWQADDTATRDLIEACKTEVSYPLRILYSPTAGVVPAENTALDAAVGQIILLIDDDAIAPPDWLERHLAFYAKNPRCGAVGGPAINFNDGIPLPRRTVEPLGLLTWYGRHIGNMYDHVDSWKSRPPRRVQHLVGYNMSLRREAFDRFETGLKAYWQLFEMDACLQAAARGFEVWFDFGNVIEHHPTSQAYLPERDSNLEIKIFNLAYNDAYVLSKFSPWPLRVPRMAYLLLVGMTREPGVLASLYAMKKFGHPMRELMILRKTWQSRFAGWSAGQKARREFIARSAS